MFRRRITIDFGRADRKPARETRVNKNRSADRRYPAPLAAPLSPIANALVPSMPSTLSELP